MLNIKEMTEKFDEIMSKFTKEDLQNFLDMFEKGELVGGKEKTKILEPQIQPEKNQVLVSITETDEFTIETTKKVIVNIPTKPLYVKVEDECFVGIFPSFYNKQDPELVTHLKFLRFSTRDNKLDVLSGDTYVSGKNFSDLINYDGNSDVKNSRVFSIKYAIFVMMYLEDHHFVTKEEFVKHLDITKNKISEFYYQM